MSNLSSAINIAEKFIKDYHVNGGVISADIAKQVFGGGDNAMILACLL